MTIGVGVNSLIIVTLTVLAFWAGYIFYAGKIESIFKPDIRKKTPAYFKYDGIDYVPAKHWSVLFGHHFASIAGAAPIIGPILALSLWGWAPTLIWIVLGTVFIGGIHDFASLMTSVRHRGSSIAILIWCMPATAPTSSKCGSTARPTKRLRKPVAVSCLR